MHPLTQSAQAMGSLRRIIEKYQIRKSEYESYVGGNKRISAGKCPICGREMIKHIVCEGARFHVHSYDTTGIHCSEKDCEDNHGKGKCDKGA